MAEQTDIDDKDFRDLFLKSPSGRLVVSVEENGVYRFCEVNFAMMEILEVPRLKLLGRTPEEAFDLTTAEQMNVAFAQCESERKVCSFTASQNFSGGARLHTFMLTPLTGQGNKVQFIEMASRPDVVETLHVQRERDDALKMLTTLFDDSGLDIIVTDQTGRIVRVNETFLVDYGWAKEKLLGESFTVLLPADSHDTFRKLHTSFIDHGRPGAREIKILRADGSVADVAVTTSLLELSQKRRYMVSIAKDISERKQLLRSIRKSKEDAEIANRAKSSFLANMSSDLRVPLNNILGFLEGIKAAASGDIKQQEHLEDAHRHAAHLMDIVNDVLEMAQMDARKLSLFETEVSVDAALQSVIRIMKDRAEKSGVRFSLSGTQGIFLWADARFFKQSLINILSNAVRFSPVGGHVRVDVQRSVADGLEISVTDEGVGIPEDKKTVILDPYGHIHDPKLYLGKGTGLGLPLAKTMVTLHEGTVTIDPDYNKGTRVRIQYPAKRLIDK